MQSLEVTVGVQLDLSGEGELLVSEASLLLTASPFKKALNLTFHVS